MVKVFVVDGVEEEERESGGESRTSLGCQLWGLRWKVETEGEQCHSGLF